MGEPVSFLTCSFCGRSDSDPEINFIIRSSLGKGAAVCDLCVKRLYVLTFNCYNDLFEDGNGYTLE